MFSNKFSHRSLSFGFANTYVISKALSEDLIASYAPTLPIVIVRPSAVHNALREPIVGYAEGLSGSIGCVASCMTGLTSNFYGEPSFPVNLTPVDFVANCTIVSACKRSAAKSQELLVYNCTTDKCNSMTFGSFIAHSVDAAHQWPLHKNMFWYPSCRCTSSKLRMKILVLLFQLLPAFLLDTVLRVLGKEPR